MSLEEAFKWIDDYGIMYEMALTIEFPYTVFLHAKYDFKIMNKSVCIADTWQEACIKLATRIQDGLI